MIYFAAALLLVGIYFFRPRKKTVLGEDVLDNIVNDTVLKTHVFFYTKLSADEQLRFREEAKAFLNDVKITGVDTTVSDTDRLLIASGAIIPIFNFKGWRYYNLKEVLLYSDAIDMNFASTGQGRDILGMVGSGYMEGKMLLSKPALENGFDNRSDKNNTVIHEFVHLIDKMDGDTDGVPQLLLDKQYVLPWLHLIQEETARIAKDDSDINPYAYTNKSEFFAVASEYFFERPELLESKHPELYAMLLKIFQPSKSQV